MNCSICKKEYQTYDETKACYDSHKPQETIEEKQTSPLDALNKLYKQRSEAPKCIQPKNVIHGEEAPQTMVDRLIGIAKDNDTVGYGKITLGEARTALADKTLNIQDVIRLINDYAPGVIIEQRSGNMLHLHFSKTVRNKPVLVNPKIPQLPKHVNGI